MRAPSVCLDEQLGAAFACAAAFASGCIWRQADADADDASGAINAPCDAGGDATLAAAAAAAARCCRCRIGMGVIAGSAAAAATATAAAVDVLTCQARILIKIRGFCYRNIV